MTTWTIAPSFATQLDEEPRVLAAQFGDGYQQRVGDGINIRARKWAVVFNDRTATERDAILAALRGENGITAFNWTDPLGYTGKFVARKWSSSLVNAVASTVSTTFEEVFEP